MAVDDVVTLRVVGRYQSQNIVNTLHYQIAAQAANEQTVLDNLLIGWEADLEVLWLARHLDTYELVGLKAFNKVGAAKTPAFRAIATAGSVVGEEVPSSVCRTLTLYTASAKHRRRGRLMLSGTAVAMLETDDGAVTSMEQASLDTLGTTLLATIEQAGDEFNLVIPATAVDPVEPITDAKGRPTPSLIKSRRIREFLVG